MDRQGGAGGGGDSVPRDRETGERLSGAQSLQFLAPDPTVPSWTGFHEISVSSKCIPREHVSSGQRILVGDKSAGFSWVLGHQI